MARILFANIPLHGHANPTFPLVSAFVNNGHEVDYLITEDFQKKVEYCGATIIPYYRSVNINLSNPFDSIKKVRESINEMYIKVKKLASKYDAVVIGGLCPSLAELQEEVKTPIIFCSAVFLQNEETIKELFKKSRGIPNVINFIAHHPKIRRRVSKIFGARVLKVKVNDLLTFFSPQSASLNIIFTSRYFQPRENDFQNKCLYIGPTPTISVKDKSFPIESLENSNKKVIYATLGTVFNTWTDFFKNVIEAFKDSEYLVVMSTGNKDRIKEIGYIPENFIVRDFVPQAEVLKHADLFIAHGGMGSVSDGMYLGVPMIMVPLGADQFFNSYRLQDLGAGKVLKKKEVTAENLKLQAKLMLESSTYKKQVKKVQESFTSSCGPEQAVKEVEKILRNYNL
ncbi:macrolide family glycosyltransferase [Clostridium cellulovorans]|uniref:Glycosyltransferase, MGT family n=1 Tax=Clostridium cellulovorans (strain ATCC 35296 / DSM 3052 / OCM 3 / 743B) TaxID=573061 RepID=D9SV61_CLOC7|nr:macrolide family glycosyltransferase [Clostridium cellulovorans]ADL53035.1 glycosyltransferase, MGT family [Clostridium cellulovorans 743B]